MGMTNSYLWKTDFDNIQKTKQNSDLIVVKANPLCEIIQ